MVGYGLKESKKTGKCQGKYLSAKSNSHNGRFNLLRRALGHHKKLGSRSPSFSSNLNY